MALQVPSGLITSQSGGGQVSGTVLPIYAYPIPVVIVGANGASASGNHSITDTSGVLNVFLNSGAAISVSGDVVLVVSGGTIQVSGNVTTASGSLVNIISASGNKITDFSGAINVNISGGSVGTTLAGYQSGTLVGISGGAVGLSGLIGVSLSGTVTVGTSGVNAIVLAVSGGAILQAGDTGANINLRVSVWNGTQQLGTGNMTTDGNSASSIDILTESRASLFNGSTWDRVRSVTASSGAFLGVIATGPAPWKYTNITAAGITNIYQSGPVLLHAVNIGDYSSGLGFRIRDAQSGAGGTLVQAVEPFIGGLSVTDIGPVSLLYDALLTSGLVIDTSGTGWNVTALWRNMTS